MGPNSGPQLDGQGVELRARKRVQLLQARLGVAPGGHGGIRGDVAPALGGGEGLAQGTQQAVAAPLGKAGPPGGHVIGGTLKLAQRPVAEVVAGRCQPLLKRLLGALGHSRPVPVEKQVAEGVKRKLTAGCAAVKAGCHVRDKPAPGLSLCGEARLSGATPPSGQRMPQPVLVR
jgi:hypothetical protein